MILLLHKLGFPLHHHHRHHYMSASLQAFRSLVSENLNRALESLKPGSEFLSLTWIYRCFNMLTVINNAFAKLMVEIDYPVATWEGGSIDEYLDYTINLLHLLNSITSSISHVNQARVSLMHALSLMESSPALAIERMREIKKKQDSISVKEVKSKTNGCDDRNEKEWIFHEAVMVMKSVGFWVCAVVLSGLKGDLDPMMGNMVFVDLSLVALDSAFKKMFMEEGGIVKEVKGVNESVRLIVSSGIIDDSNGGMELKRRLEMVGNGLMRLKEEEECIFRTTMDARNEVLQILRRNNK